VEGPSDRSPRPVPRGHPAKRQAIIDAALRLFARDGYAATALEDVAREAPASRQTVYSHFGDKETLFRAVVESHLAATLEVLTEARSLPPMAAGVDPVAHLDELARRLAAIARDPRSASLQRLLQAEGPRRPELFEQWRTRVARPVFAEVAAHLTGLAHAGVLRIDDPVRAAGQFIALVWSTGWQLSALRDVAGTPAQGPDDADLAAARTASVELFVRGYR